MRCTWLAENAGCKKSPFWHHRTTLSGYIFATKAPIDNRKKNLLSSNISSTSPQYGELWPTSGWALLASLRHPSTFQRVSRRGSITARHCSSGRQPNFAALNRGRKLCSAGRPSRWALAHILVCNLYSILFRIMHATIHIHGHIRPNSNNHYWVQALTPLLCKLQPGTYCCIWVFWNQGPDFQSILRLS